MWMRPSCDLWVGYLSLHIFAVLEWFIHPRGDFACLLSFWSDSHVCRACSFLQQFHQSASVCPLLCFFSTLQRDTACSSNDQYCQYSFVPHCESTDKQDCLASFKSVYRIESGHYVINNVDVCTIEYCRLWGSVEWKQRLWSPGVWAATKGGLLLDYTNYLCLLRHNPWWRLGHNISFGFRIWIIDDEFEMMSVSALEEVLPVQCVLSTKQAVRRYQTSFLCCDPYAMTNLKWEHPMLFKLSSWRRIYSHTRMVTKCIGSWWFYFAHNHEHSNWKWQVTVDLINCDNLNDQMPCITIHCCISFK